MKIFNFFEDFQQKGLFFMAKFTVVCYNKMYRFMTIQILLFIERQGESIAGTISGISKDDRYPGYS